MIDTRGNLMDRAIAYFDPERAARRLRARMAMAIAGSWKGASRSSRTLGGWNPLGGDSDSDDLPDLPTLRERSRDAIRNMPLARGAINTKVTSIVGSGLKLQSRVDGALLGLTEAQTEAQESVQEREFRLWAESPNCDAARGMNLYEIQDLAFRSCLANGDTLILMPSIERANWPYRLALQLVEADRLRNKDNNRDDATMTAGIERDMYGAPIRYHFARAHPGNRMYSTATEWDSVPAFAPSGRRNVLHLFRRERIGQTRGIPDLAAVIEPLKQVTRYTDSELAATVVSSMFTVFVMTQDGGGLGPMQPGAETGAGRGDQDVKLASGAIVDLAPGEDVKFADPSRPNANFDPFVMAVLRHIGTALELPFEILIKHFTASYSAARAAMIEAWRFFLVRRRWLALSLCQPVYEALMAEAVATGRVRAPGFFSDPIIRRAYCGALWIGDGRGQINEQAETGAAIDRIEAGLSTLSEETAAINGGDWERNHMQRAKEVRRRREDGLEASTSTAVPLPLDEGVDES